jgi:signal transduction histidine kinase
MPEKKNRKNNIIGSINSDFANLTSHQLRTPLSGMKWMLELLQKSDTGNLNKKQKQFLEKLYSLNERMIALVNDLLEVSRIEHGDTKLYLQPTDIAVIIRELLRDKARLIALKRLKVTFTVEREPFPVVRTESIKIKQALSNLISNAITYTPDDGNIRIDLRLMENEPNMLVCSIMDTGMGIPKDQEGQIFEKFFRGSNVSKVESVGSGLGLYIAKAFVEASGGKIWFKSILGKGTTFYFSLPIARTK